MSDIQPIEPSELGIAPKFAMPARRHGIGIVGFGSIARYAHAPAYQQMGWPIVAVADIDPGARETARTQFGVDRIYERYEDLIADPAVDVIDLLTLPTLREDAVKAAAAVHKPIIAEKPLATTMAEAERMVAIAAEAGIPLGVHQNYRWMATNYVVRELLEGGWIGAPFLLSIEIFGTQDRYLAGHAYFSTCTDFLPVQWNNHLADLLRYWTGRDALRVWTTTRRMAGQKFVADNLLISIHDFGSELTGHILHHELLQVDAPSQPCRVDGDGGSLLFDLWGDSITIHSVRLAGSPRELQLQPLGLPHSMAGSMGDFLGAVEDGREPMVSGRANLATLRAIFGELASARQGGAWVSVSA
jgi:predicted dehydrogenase